MLEGMRTHMDHSENLEDTVKLLGIQKCLLIKKSNFDLTLTYIGIFSPSRTHRNAQFLTGTNVCSHVGVKSSFGIIVSTGVKHTILNMIRIELGLN